uniref:Uncharacterized protein n=1 Tax=Anguilla anguilla TaxID=7936 RepID=A0A0E9U041_ANGAN
MYRKVHLHVSLQQHWPSEARDLAHGSFSLFLPPSLNNKNIHNTFTYGWKSAG